jgi:hypothetical protein
MNKNAVSKKLLTTKIKRANALVVPRSSWAKLISILAIVMLLSSPIIPETIGIGIHPALNPPPSAPTLTVTVRRLPEGFNSSAFPEFGELYPNYVHLEWSVPENAITYWSDGAEECRYIPKLRWETGSYGNSWGNLPLGTDGIWITGRYLSGDPNWWMSLPMWTTWEDVYFSNYTISLASSPTGRVTASFCVNPFDLLIAEMPADVGAKYGQSNIITVDIGYGTPKITEIKVTGIPDTENPTTNCPTTPVVEKVKLEAVVDCSEHFQITKVSWSGDGVKPGEGNPYEYEAAPGTQGKKNVMCAITYRSVEFGWTRTDTKSKEFRLFFAKGQPQPNIADDNSNGIPNWFEYWKDALGMSTEPIYYKKDVNWGHEYPGVKVLIGDNAGFGPAPRSGKTNIDCFYTVMSHEFQHFLDDQEVINRYGRVRNVPAADDNDRDFLPNDMDPFPNAKNGANLAEYSGAKAWMGDWEFLARIAENAIADPKVDWANPGKQSAGLGSSSSSVSAFLEGPAQVLGFDFFDDPSLAEAKFTGSHSDNGFDSDSDGLFDYLVVQVEVNVTTAGNCTIVGGLEGDGYIIWGSNSAYLDTGIHSMVLNFDGSVIRRHRENGPFQISLDLDIEDWLNPEECSMAFNTSAYQYSQFKGSATQFSGIFSDHCTDTDGDGAYDNLTVTVGVNSVVLANYTLEGCLCNARGDVINNARDTKLVNVGDNLFSLNFDALSIFASRTDGPYSIRFLNLCYENGTQADFINDAFNTSAFSYRGFGGAKAMFTGACDSRVGDANGDSLFDYLTIGVNMTVLVSGNYTVAGSLFDLNGTEIACESMFSFLNSSATPQIFLTFSGFPIHESGVIGPYMLSHLTLYNENGTVIDSIPNLTVNFAENTNRVSDIGDYVLQAVTDKAYFVYGDPNRMTSVFATYDVAAGGIVYGLCLNSQIQRFDTEATTVSQNIADKGRLMLDGKTALMFGGPNPNLCVRYLEQQRLTPLYFQAQSNSSGTYLKFLETSTETAKVNVRTSSYDSNHEDYFIIETLIDASSNRIFISYGFDWKGTWAAGLYLKAQYDNIQNFTNSYYVFHWIDTNSNGIPEANENTRVATG